MSYIDKRQEARPTTGEAPFKLDEIFFSRTDERGVIEAANYIFCRVAAFDWDDMLRAPHKIIRHPDMPKGVFWLLWDAIKRGETVSAYVKNLAKDGLHYWVLATVMPCTGGYLSVRIKPTSAVFDLVQQEYATLLAAEQTQDIDPETSGRALLARLQELGFADFGAFSIHALREELLSRDKILNIPPNKKITRAVECLALAKSLDEETQALVQEFESMRTIPHNMRVIASRLEPTGGPVSTLSHNYGEMSQAISDWFGQHITGPGSDFSAINHNIKHSMFLDCVVHLLGETRKQFEIERRRLGDVHLQSERQILKGLHDKYCNDANSEIQLVRNAAGAISSACKIMNRQILGLSTTRVMCKIEGARMGDKGGGLDDIITQLDTFQSRISTRLENIQRFSESIQSA